jgi:hypothetical protein
MTDDELIDIETIDNFSIITTPPIINSSKITKKKKMSITEKRHRNNLASRKSRQKKLNNISTLKQKVKNIQLEKNCLYKMIHNLEKNNKKLIIKNKALKNNFYLFNPFTNK